MRSFFIIDQVRAAEWGLNLTQAAAFSFCYNLASWAEKLIVNGEVYYFASRNKFAEQMPIVAEKPDTIYRLYKQLAEADLIHWTKFDGKDYICLTEKGKKWGSSERSEKNPSERKEIRNSSENFPTNNIVIDNSTPHFKNAESLRKKKVEKGTSDFDSFWSAYAYKKDRAVALKAWAKLTAEEQAEAIRCAPIYASETVISDTDKAHWKPRRKFPATWLNGRGWEDYQEQAKQAETEQAIVTPYDGDYSKYLDWVRENCPVITAAVKYLSKPQYIQYREMGERVRLSGPVMYRLLTKSHREFEEGRTTHPTAYDHFIQAIADHRRKTQEI